MIATLAGPPCFATIPRVFDGMTIACLGSGPSLSRDDVEQLIAKNIRLIAINDAHRLAPEADLLFAADARWWDWKQGVPDFAGPKYAIDRVQWPDVRRLRNAGLGGLETKDASAVRTGYTSGYAAINIAVHLGATRIVLVGYDMHGSHFFGAHPDNSVPPFELGRKKFDELVQPLADLHIAIVNASRRTTITSFPRVVLDELSGDPR